MSRILITVGDGIGNIIMVTPMISALYQMGAEIDVVGEPNYANGHHVLKNRPEIRNVFDSLENAGSYDVVISTVGGLKVARKLKYIRLITVTPSDYVNKSEIENNMDVARQLGWNGETPDCFCGYVKSEHKMLDRTIGLHNGTHFNPVWKRKEYPYYKELVTLLSKKFQLAIFGDTPLTDLGLKNFIAYDCTVKSIEATAGFMKECSLFIGTDSGLSHMAAALNVPTWILWGPTDIRKNKPPKAEIIRSAPDCPTCQSFTSNWEKNSRWSECADWRCMKTPPELIMERLVNREY